ncbi:MAG: tetratricopeptide repeat protein [Elusimicrobiota bacterium]
MGKSKKARALQGQEGVPTSSLFAQKALLWWLPILYLLISDSFFLRTYDSAQVKITLVQMGGICMLALWLCRLLDEGKGLFSKTDLVTLAPFMAYFAYSIFSYIHAPYKFSSLDSFLRRIFYMTVPLIVIREFHEKSVQRLTRILIWTTWITVGYGMLQWFDITFFERGVGKGPDPFIWRGAFGLRVFSTFGNPNFFADFLVLIFPVLVCQYMKTRDHKLIPLIGMLMWNLYSTGTKGAWIGFAVALTLLTATYVYFFNFDLLRRYRSRLLTCFLVLMGFVGSGVVYKLNNSRWVSVNFRLFTWEATWEMVMTQPLIGTGIGSFWVIYPAFRRPPIFHIEGKHNTETDHAENEWLEVLFDEGILGFGIFLWLVVCACMIGYRALSQLTGGLKMGQRAPPRAYDVLGYLIAFQGMLAHNVFDVSMRFVSSGVYLGLLSGLVVNLARGRSLAELHSVREAAPPPGSDPPATPKAALWPRLSAFFIWPARLAAWGALGYMVWTFSGQFQKLQGPLFGMRLGGEILQWWIAWGCFLLCVLSQAFIFARTALLTRNALIPAIILLMVWPLKLSWGFFRADVHHNIAIYFSKQKNWERALENYLMVGKLNPAFVMSFYFKGNVFNDRFNMAKVYNDKWGDRDDEPRDDFERAMEAYEEVRSKAPNYVQMHHQVGVLYVKRADWERQQGRPEEAEKYLDMALERFELYRKHDPVFAPNFYRIAQIHMQRKHYDKAIETYKAYLDGHGCGVSTELSDNSFLRRNLLAYQDLYERDDGTWQHEHPETEAYTQLGNAYFFKGDLIEGEKAYKEALRLDANNQNAQRNLNVLYNRAKSMNRLKVIPPPALEGQPQGAPVFEIAPSP